MLKLCIWLQKGVWDSFTLFYFESEKLVRKLQNISAFEDISLIRKYHFILLKLSWFLNQCLFKINQSGTCITCKPVCFACFFMLIILKNLSIFFYASLLIYLFVLYAVSINSKSQLCFWSFVLLVILKILLDSSKFTHSCLVRPL